MGNPRDHVDDEDDEDKNGEDSSKGSGWCEEGA